MHLFKYLKREYAQRMMNDGVVHIGTLSYYRNVENEAITDRDEGKKNVATNFPEEIVIKDKKDWEKHLGFLKGANFEYKSPFGVCT